MKGTILKLQTPVDIHSSNEGVKINKLLSSISPADFIKLLRKANNKVNPRSAKRNPITKSIHETLEISPELFWYKTKGLLLATETLEQLDRNRIRISLDDDDHEGIMDGGHNTFAIASYLIEKLHDKKVKAWDDCKQYWDSNYDQILADFNGDNHELDNFSIPVEIVYPKNEDGSLDEFRDYISEICSARNNNVQLTEASKGNKVGLYDDLKRFLDSEFDIIWKSGEAGKIKSEDVISIATIPLIFLQESGRLPLGINQLNPVNVYSQKSKCVDFYNAFLSHPDVSAREQGKHTLTNSFVESGLSMVADILRFFDRVYVEFPKLYNNVSPGFGRIKSVDDKTKVSMFRTAMSDYTYPPGFVFPLITGVIELMEIDQESGMINWSKNPSEINLENLDMAQYINAIKLANYDPQTVGKQTLFYQQARSIFENYLAR